MSKYTQQEKDNINDNDMYCMIFAVQPPFPPSSSNAILKKLPTKIFKKRIRKEGRERGGGKRVSTRR